MKILNRIFPYKYYKIKLRQCIADSFLHQDKAIVKNESFARLIKTIKGSNNAITIGKRGFLDKLGIRIIGNNNSIIIGDHCHIGPGCSLWIEGNNSTITISSHCTFTESIHICCQEDNMNVFLDEDCMLSNNIVIRTSDSHPIYDGDTKIRLNHPKSVYIGKHVWIAPNSKVLKGAYVNEGVIIGSNSIVTGNVPAKTLVVGAPAKIVKENIVWTRENIF